MSKEKMRLFHRIYNIIYSIFLIIAGILLIAGCLTIYFTGERTYSREIVAEVFAKIDIYVYICLALTVIGFVIELASPSVKEKAKIERNNKFILEKLSSKKDITSADENTAPYIYKERKIRIINVIIRTAVILITSIIFLAYALNSNHFDQREVTDSMIKAMWILTPCMAASFAFAVFTAYFNEKSILREIELLKALPNAEVSQVHKTHFWNSPKFHLALKIAFSAIAVAAVIYGFIAGGTADVLAKATKICTECIGLG